MYESRNRLAMICTASKPASQIGMHTHRIIRICGSLRQFSRRRFSFRRRNYHNTHIHIILWTGVKTGAKSHIKLTTTAHRSKFINTHRLIIFHAASMTWSGHSMQWQSKNCNQAQSAHRRPSLVFVLWFSYFGFRTSVSVLRFPYFRFRTSVSALPFQHFSVFHLPQM